MNVRRESNRLYGGTYALTCAESFLATRGRNRPYVYWTALVLCAGTLLSLPIVHVDITVQERGRVRPAIERTAIVARTAGFISSVRVHDNDLVHAGTTLLTLNTQALQAKVDFNDSQRKVLNQELADLRYLLERVANKRPVAINELQTGKYITEYQKYDTDYRNANLKVDHTEREMNRNKQLLAIKVVAARDFEESSYQANAARVEREALNHEASARWQADRVQKEHELEQLESEARQLADERNLYSVKAPLDGAVIDLGGLVEGSYLQSGQRIGDISPTSDFVIEVSVPPKDVGRIYIGQPVNIQVDAYPYAIWGLLPGQVLGISADYVQEGENNNNGGFKVIVHADRDCLRTREGLTGSLKKGMTANARFFVANRSLWELVYQNMDDLFNPALKRDALPPDRAPSSHLQ
jgi:membrane fusion protein, peptide pheromone/bacteriocin exporter